MANRLEKVFSYKSGDEELRVTIGINDDCKNGHADFTISYDHRVNGQMEGWCHDYETAKNYGLKVKIPESDLAIFRRFEPLHLCDQDGAPMYPIANGWYYLNEGKLGVFANQMRISIEEAERASKLITSKESLYAWLCVGGHIDRWKREANEAIAILEELCGQKFDLVRTRASELSEYASIHPNDFEFNEADAQKTQTAQRLKIIEEELLRVKQYNKEQVAKIMEDNMRKEMALQVIADYIKEHLIPNPLRVLRCFIVYDHINTIVFNWHYSMDNIPYEYAYGLCKHLQSLNDGLQYKVGRLINAKHALSNEEFEWYNKLEEEGLIYNR